MRGLWPATQPGDSFGALDDLLTSTQQVYSKGVVEDIASRAKRLLSSDHSRDLGGFGVRHSRHSRRARLAGGGWLSAGPDGTPARAR
jgi:hypothetical protein